MSDKNDSLERLLRNASPRPVPSQADAATAREAVHAEWHAVGSKYRSRKRRISFALAASILMGIFALSNVDFGPKMNAVKVAEIQKSFGSIYVLGEQSELTLAKNLTAVFSGQTIVTGDDAGMALSWSNGGSVRLDKNTEVEFSGNNMVRLRSGRIYFDSRPSGLIAVSVDREASFDIETEHGIVSHVGTQFMTQVDADELKVSVRAGQVEIAGQYFPYTASRGEQVVLSGRQRPVVLNVSEYGENWAWIGRTSPVVDVDGKSVHAFLIWAGRELGMRIEYADAAVENVAHDALLEGRVDTDPAEALRLRMLTAALDWHFSEGVIYVSDSN